MVKVLRHERLLLLILLNPWDSTERMIVGTAENASDLQGPSSPEHTFLQRTMRQGGADRVYYIYYTHVT